MTFGSTSAVAIFCEGVRDEVAGSVTITGVYPDNMEVPGVPVVLPSLAVYFRVVFDPSAPPKRVVTFLKFPDGTEVGHNEVPEKVIEDAKAVGHLGTFFSRVETHNFPVPAIGCIQAMVDIDGVQRTCAILNIKLPAT